MLEWRYNNNSKSQYKTEFELLQMFCGTNNLNLTDIALVRAKFKGVQLAFSTCFQTQKTEDAGESEIDKEASERYATLDEFLIEIADRKNSFCEAMPIKVPIEYFKIFIDRKNNAGNYYLTLPQFIAFIKKGFLNCPIREKITINVGAGEKGLVLSRFYEFYRMAVNAFENTTQCKEKYINLVHNNFNNWDIKQLKGNFRNQTGKSW